MELRHLRYFVTVAEEMNVHSAAKRLHISQPPLSLSIKQLEEEIGTLLFERKGRSIYITRAGKNFLNEAKKILKDVDTAKNTTKLIGSGKKGVLKIGFISSSITGVLQDIVKASRKSNPEIILELEQAVAGPLETRILSGQYDIGIDRYPIKNLEGLTSQRLTKEGWSAVFPIKHPFAKLKSVSINQLAKENLVFYPYYNSPLGHSSIMGLFDKKGLTPHIVQEAPEQMTIAALVASGIGVGIVPACMANIEMAGISHRHIQGTTDMTGFSLLRRDEEDRLVQNFIENLPYPI